jgi:hypothetical protein
MAAEITRFLGMSISFCDDIKSNAHVHVHYHPNNGSINLDPTLSVFNSTLPPRVAALAVEWAGMHIETLKRNWEIHKNGGTNLATIPPLVA